MNNSSLISTGLMLALFHFSALAGSAVIESGGSEGRQRANLEYRDGKLRVEPQGQSEGAMIVRDGKIFTLAQGMVIDMSSMVNMLGKQAKAAPSSGPDDISRYLGLDSAGRSETVAGVNGSVHVLRYQDGDGRSRSAELVLSQDARARELSEAMETMANGFRNIAGKPETPGEAELRAKIKGQGVLRYGSDFRVVSFGNGQPSASRFELPSAPQQIPNLGGALGASPAAAAPADSSQDGGMMGRIFGSKAKRQQDRVEQRTESEIDQTTDKAVDSVLDKAMGKIFGN